MAAGGSDLSDTLARVFVYVADTMDHRLFFVQFKERVKARFQQQEIWLTTFPIELI